MDDRVSLDPKIFKAATGLLSEWKQLEMTSGLTPERDLHELVILVFARTLGEVCCVLLAVKVGTLAAPIISSKNS